MCRHRGIRRVIRGLNGILDYSLLLLLLLGLVYGCYALWDSQNLAEEATSEQYAIYKPQEDTLGFQELQSMNSDVIAWITVYDTPIDYPVVQGKDDMEYITANQDALIGKILEIKCSGLSQDNKGNYSVLHPVYKLIRTDKSIANTLTECIEINNSSSLL